MQSGNLSAAQSDFATLQQLRPPSESSSAQSDNPIAQAFNQLAQDLQGGNLSAAQQDFATIQQDFQNRTGQAQQGKSQNLQSDLQEAQQVFQQLGQDLQAGNLSAAQSDFATLQQLKPQNNPTSSAQSNNPIAQAFQQLAQDLQAGNLTGAQQDFANIQQDLQNQATNTQQDLQNQAPQGQHHHHHGGGDDASAISQTLTELGQALQAGNLSDAQQAYSALQQDFQQSQGNSGSQFSTQTGSNGTSVSA